MCCFLSPTSWQPFLIATAVYCLMSLQSCQHTVKIMSHNLQLWAVRSFPVTLSHLPKQSICQRTTVYNHLIIPELKLMITLLNSITIMNVELYEDKMQDTYLGTFPTLQSLLRAMERIVDGMKICTITHLSAIKLRINSQQYNKSSWLYNKNC